MVNSYSYRSRGKKSGSVFYIIVAVALAIFMFKWGLPLFVDLLAGPGGEIVKQQTEDTIPPQTPILSALPEATNSARIIVEGYTEADAEVTALVNGDRFDSAQTGEDGAFRFEVTLKDGENTIIVSARDKAGNESVSPAKTVVFDVSPIQITLDSPKDGDEFFVKDQSVTVSGKVNKSDAAVTVNGSLARTDADGNFSSSLRLSEGENTITVKAVGRAGNQSEKSITVRLTL